MFRKKIVVSTLTLLAITGPAATDEAQQLDWLTGCWQSANGETREVWSASEDGYYFGYSVAFDQGQAVFFEQMRIDPGPEPVFNAYPRGPGPSAFPAIESSDNTITFANSAHDFPQKIRYEKVGDTLKAAISKIDDSNRTHFEFSPCPAQTISVSHP